MSNSAFDPEFPPFVPNQIWQLDPRDPAVLGDGRSGLAFVEGGTWPFPYPGTLAGMVRTLLLNGESRVGPEEAQAVLKQVRIRGPWLVEPPQASPPTEPLLPYSRIRVPAPADVRLTPKNSATKQARHLLGATLLKLNGDEGVLWPWEESDQAGLRPLALCELPQQRGGKLQPLHGQHWPFSLAVAWGLGQRPDNVTVPEVAEPFATLAAQAAEEAGNQRRFLHRESRMHVVIEDGRGTAEAGLLFSSGGVRLEEGWALGLEVNLPPARRLPANATRLAPLGGEGRMSYLATDDYTAGHDAAFPPFDHYRALYQQAAQGAGGLRLQLISPAFLPTREKEGDLYHRPGDPAWCPSWLNPLAGGSGVPPQLRALFEAEQLRLRLYAACIPGYDVVSGWNLQGARLRQKPPRAGKREATGAPREVRRLVPAGSVYYLQLQQGGQPLSDADRLAELLPRICEGIWGSTIDPAGPGEWAEALSEEFRAPAAFDGYGLVLPGIWYR